MDTTVLRDVLMHEGPFVSLFLDSTQPAEDAAKERDLRWRAARETLLSRGADQATVAAIEDAIHSAAPVQGRAGRFLVAAHGDVLVDESLPVPPAAAVARVSPLPYLLPLAELSQRGVPYVVVVVDQIGADIRVMDAEGTQRAEYRVEGRDHPVHKVGGAGWAHRSVHKRAEETVRRNLADVAHHTDRAVQRAGARLLVIAGEVQARAELREALTPRCRQIAAEIDTGRRAQGASAQDFDHDVAELVAERWRAEQHEVLDRFRAELARSGGRAVQGIGRTAEALRDGNAQVLVISDPTLADKSVWTGSRLRHVAVDRAELHRVGASERSNQRADEALPAAAIAVGADVLAADEPLPLTDGVGALLRHT